MKRRLLPCGAVLLLLRMVFTPALPVLSAQESPTVRFSGELRLRGEWDGRTVGVGDDAATLSRIRLGARVALNGWLGAFAQLQDARAWGTEGNTLTDASADRLDLHQGYAEIGHAERVLGRLGRQEIALGDERLVGAVGWANTGQAFDGARLLGRTGGFDWNVFWMNVAERDSLLATGPNPQVNQGVERRRVADWRVRLAEVRRRHGRVHRAGRPEGRDGRVVHHEPPSPRRRRRVSAMRGPAPISSAPADRPTSRAGGWASAWGRARWRPRWTTCPVTTIPPPATRRRSIPCTPRTTSSTATWTTSSTSRASSVRRGSWMPCSAAVSPFRRRRAFGRTCTISGSRESGSNAQGMGTEIDLVGNWTMAQYAGLEVGGGLYLPTDLATTAPTGLCQRVRRHLLGLRAVDAAVAVSPRAV